MNTARLESTADAARILREGGLVAFPTETVYGLGVDATNRDAIERLFVAKGRPSDNPLIVHLGDAADWVLAAAELTPSADALLRAFAPGPMTVVLPKNESICDLVTAGLDTVGIRVPSEPVAAEIVRLAGVPVAAPSANRSGRPSATSWRSVLEDLDGRIDAVFCRDVASVGVESTVVDCSDSQTTVLRPGAVTLEQIRAVVPGAVALGEPSGQGRGDAGKSPGLLHPHYQPRAAVRLVDHPDECCDDAGPGTAYCGLEPLEGVRKPDLCVEFSDIASYAEAFYEFLREADRQSIKTVFVQRAPDEGLGRALLDRQRRAAGET